MMSIPLLKPWLAAAAILLFSGSTWAQDAAIRKTLAERLPQLPKIDEITRTPIAGLYEVRFGGNQLMYSDEKGEYILINGSMVETKTRSDLTEARLDKLMAIDFDKLPVKDAMVVRQGNGSRKMAVFADPNCGYCKRFERDLLAVKDVTIYTFLIPILGPDSTAKARDIWCAKDAQRTWRAWMIDGTTPPKVAGTCDTKAMDRNLAFSHSNRINGTPAVFFEDGSRAPGAMGADVVEKRLLAATKK